SCLAGASASAQRQFLVVAAASVSSQTSSVPSMSSVPRAWYTKATMEKPGEAIILAPHFRQATEADADELARLRWDFSPDYVAASGQSFAEFRAGISDGDDAALPSLPLGQAGVDLSPRLP